MSVSLVRRYTGPGITHICTPVYVQNRQSSLHNTRKANYSMMCTPYQDQADRNTLPRVRIPEATVLSREAFCATYYTLLYSYIELRLCLGVLKYNSRQLV